jgi:hypothetical protein
MENNIPPFKYPSITGAVVHNCNLRWEVDVGGSQGKSRRNHLKDKLKQKELGVWPKT